MTFGSLAVNVNSARVSCVVRCRAGVEGRDRRAWCRRRPTPTPPTGGWCGRPGEVAQHREQVLAAGQVRVRLGDVHAVISPSSQHLKLEPGTLEVNVKLALVLSVDLVGTGAIVTTGGSATVHV